MKRLNNLYQQIISIDNLRLADKKARRGKSKQPGVKAFDKQSETNLFLLHEMLLNKQYKTSEYSVFKVFDRKEREVYRLPYFPDRITHHAVMNILEPIFVAVFTADSYSCIKGKGIHGNSFALRKALKDVDNTTFYLQMDIKKFYQNVDHVILKQLLRRKIKDKDYNINMFVFDKAKASFKTLWESINGEDAWKENPWVWVIEFKKVTK